MLVQVPGRAAPPLGFWDLLSYIVDEPPPALPSQAFSPELCDFVRLCLQVQNAPVQNSLLLPPAALRHPCSVQCSTVQRQCEVVGSCHNPGVYN